METIPKKDVDFNVAQENITRIVGDNVDAWKLDEEWLTTKVAPAKNTWVQKWAAYQDPAARTTVITFEKTEARKNYEALLRQLVKSLQSNPRVSDDDLKRMNIAIPSSGHSPSPVPTTYPAATVDSSVMRRLTINFRDVDSNTTAKPKGVHGAEIKWGIFASPIIDPEVLPNSSFDTRTPFTLEFSSNDRGKMVYFCLRWENTIGEKGPWGEMESAVIP